MLTNIRRRALRAQVSDKTMRQLRTSGAFFREFVHAPSHVGSICPSSRALTSALIHAVPVEQDGLIIDLGAGSGIVTEELLRSGTAPERIIAIELASGFRKVFAQRCPGVPLVIGNACELGAILDCRAPGKEICAIISSLPFRVMPTKTVAEILDEMHTVLMRRGGFLVQYTYAWWMRYPLRKYGFAPRSAHLVLGNLPPAKVESYAVQDN